MPADNELRFFLFTALGIFLLLIVFMLLFINYYHKRQVANYREKQSLTIRFQKEMMQMQLEIQEQTLKNISQEIHDNIGQTLSLAKLNLNTMDAAPQAVQEGKIKDTRDLVAKAILDLRALSKTLHADIIEAGGLVRAVEFELERLNRYGALKTGLEIKGSPKRMDSKNELIVFRIVQEAMNNTIKHAHASSINIMMQYEPSLFRLSFQDNGRGFAHEKKDPFDGGAGLRNMRDRAEMIGGRLLITSNELSGTKIDVELPVV